MKKFIWLLLFLIIAFFSGAQEQIVAWEYWFDSDYNQVETQVVGAINVLEIDEAIDVSNLNYGLHNVHFRFKDERGIWGPVVSKFFTWYPGSGTPELREITAYQYWYDNDYSTAVTENITASASFDLEESLDVSALNYGLHNVHFRFKDERGIWGPVVSKFFTWFPGSGTPELREITAYQYWYDNDYSTPVTENITASASFNLEENLDVSALNYGLHNVHFRFKDERGIWGPVVSRFFTWFPGSGTPELREITAYQYWYDNDYSTPVTENITASASFNLEENLDVSALNYGLHNVHFRFKDERGIWGPVVSKFFTWYPGSGTPELREITTLEYWFDSNYDSLKSENISATAVLNLDEKINTANLKDGLHVLNYRFKDEKGGWSSALSKFFVKFETAKTYPDNEIVAFRYWIDSDTTTLKNVVLETPVKRFILDENLNVTDFPSGEHFINFQFKDKLGLWSSAAGDTVIFEPKPWADLTVSTDSACYSEIIVFTADTVDATNILWDFGDGLTSTELNPVHSYDTVGTFEVSVTVSHTPSGKSQVIVLADSISIYPTYSSLLSVEDHIIAYYPFNGDANDESGNLHHGEVFEAALTSDRSGNPDGAYLFDGTNDYIDVGDWENGGAMSFVFWARWDAFNNYSRIIDFGNGASSNNIIVCNYQTGNNLFFSNYNNTVETKYFIPALTLNQWDFYAATVDTNGVMTLFKNGEQIGQRPDGFTPNVMLRTEQYIGKSNFVADGYFKGAIDELTIYDVALSLIEIKGLYQSSSNSIPPVYDEICNSELPYSFGSQSLTQTGTYTETFQTIHGCDSIVTLNLTVNESYGPILNCDNLALTTTTHLDSEDFDQIVKDNFGNASSIADWNDLKSIENIDSWFSCMNLVHGDLMRLTLNGGYESGGRWYFAAYYPDGVPPGFAVFDQIGANFVLGSWYGLNIPVLAKVTALPPVEYEICASEIPYVFGSQELTESGVYTETFSTIHGCDSIVQLNLVVNPSYTEFDTVTVCERDLPYVFGGQELDATGEYSETFSTVSNCDSIVMLHFVVDECANVCVNLKLESGWNIFSINSNPDSVNLKTVFQPLIDNNSLVKIQDESGASMEFLAFLNSWNNEIGNVELTEGYKIKVSQTDSLEICGTQVDYPFAIPLTAGWNIIGFPHTLVANAMDVVQSLIDNNTMVKAQNEQGESIEYLEFILTWNNNIGSFIPGEGYKIKVTSVDTLWVQESYPKSIVAKTETKATIHFQPDFEGNGVDHMNIYLVGLPINVINSGDELALFDGETCVGAITVMPRHIATQTISIATSAADNQGMQGFNEGNRFALKLYSTKLNQEFILEPEILQGTPTFVKHESTVASLEKYATTGLDGISLQEISEINCYPNPFNDEITIEINLLESANVTVEAYNQVGQLIKMITQKRAQSAGLTRIAWNGMNENNREISPGIYFLKIKIDDINHFRKVIYSK